MTVPLPQSYKALGRHFGMRLEAGDVVYEQGAVPGRFYVVTSGRVVFQIVDDGGSTAVVSEAGPGECVGHVSAFSGRPTSASASAAERTVLIAVPVEQAAEAFRMSPELAVALITQFAEQGGSARRRRSPRDPDDVAAEPAAAASRAGATPASARAAARPESPAKVRLDEPLNEEWFFKDDIICPVSNTLFEYLRVRTGAVKPVSRDTDFRIVYRTVDPTYYSVVVCPECSYAAYRDDFAEISEIERRDLLAAQADRDIWGRPDLSGERGPAQAGVAFELALACYEVRRADARRRAGLLHRRAWLARQAGRIQQERELLAEAGEAYRHAYERDSTMTDAEALRAAYLIGDLYFRIGEIEQAARWLARCVDMPEAKVQTGIMRMARDRLAEARQEVFRTRKKSA